MVRQVAVYNTVMPVALARFAAAAVLRGDQGHVAECTAELERRRDVILEGLAGWPVVSPGGGWSLLHRRGLARLHARRGVEDPARGGRDRGDADGRLGRARGGSLPPVRLLRGVASNAWLRLPDRVAGTALAAAVAAR